MQESLIIIQESIVKLLRRTKETNFANIIINSVTDSKKFWKTVKPLSSDKISNKEEMNLVENNRIVKGNQKIVNDFSNIMEHVITQRDKITVMLRLNARGVY